MRRINILLLFTILTLSSYAQDSLRFTTSTYFGVFIDTSGSFSITDSLYNQALSTYIIGDSIIYGATLNAAALSNSHFQNTAPAILPIDTIYPGLAHFKVVSITIDSSPQFVIGPNTIVIWPIIYHSGTLITNTIPDSIHINVIYDTVHTGINESSLLRMYIYQTPGHLNVNFGDAQNLVQQVRIYGILGQEIYSSAPDQSRNIPITGWSAGTYICEISTPSGQKRTIKFILQ